MKTKPRISYQSFKDISQGRLSGFPRGIFHKEPSVPPNPPFRK